MLIKGLIFLKLLLFLAVQSSAIDPDALIYPGDPRYKSSSVKINPLQKYMPKQISDTFPQMQELKMQPISPSRMSVCEEQAEDGTCLGEVLESNEEDQAAQNDAIELDTRHGIIGAVHECPKGFKFDKAGKCRKIIKFGERKHRKQT